MRTFPGKQLEILRSFWKSDTLCRVSYCCKAYQLRCLWESFKHKKIKISIKDFFSKCDEIHSFLRIGSHLLKKSLMETSFFVQCFVWKKVGVGVPLGLLLRVLKFETWWEKSDWYSPMNLNFLFKYLQPEDTAMTNLHNYFFWLQIEEFLYFFKNRTFWCLHHCQLLSNSSEGLK